MSEVRNIIGFNTPSKAKAQSELVNVEQVQEPMFELNMDKLRQETAQRLNSLCQLITSNDFIKYEPMQRQQILLDFTYYSKVADTL